MARLMEDLEDKEDFDEYERRQKTEEAAKKFEEINFKKSHADDEDDHYQEDDGDDSDYERMEGDGYTSDPELMAAKREYKFGEGNKNRAMSAKTRNRAQSAKTFDEKDLRSVKLTTRDYMDNQKSQKKNGKYGVTVPKPFNFDMREKTKSKSIREKKVEEMVAEKKILEENILKHQFRSNPIPPEVLIPRY